MPPADTIPYGDDFARYYDLLYSDKNYVAECDLLEAIFAKHKATPSRILDAGCGTGGHAIELADRGYTVVGVDRSKGMLSAAHEKAKQRGVQMGTLISDLRSFALDQAVDACVSMFAVLSFQITSVDLQAALRQIHAALVPGGLLVCDVWNGTAVLTEGPQPRLKRVALNGAAAWRFATPTLDVNEQTVEIAQHLMVTDPAGVQHVVEEAQTVRYFLPREFAFHLESAGFEVLELFAFPRLGEAPTTADWTLGAVARARPTTRPEA